MKNCQEKRRGKRKRGNLVARRPGYSRTGTQGKRRGNGKDKKRQVVGKKTGGRLGEEQAKRGKMVEKKKKKKKVGPDQGGAGRDRSEGPRKRNRGQ